MAQVSERISASATSTKESFRVDATFIFIDGSLPNQTIYFRHRLHGTNLWSPVVAKTVSRSSPSTDFEVSGLEETHLYEYQLDNSGVFSSVGGRVLEHRSVLTKPIVLTLGYAEASNTSAKLVGTVYAGFSNVQPVADGLNLRGLRLHARYREDGSSQWIGVPSVRVNAANGLAEVDISPLKPGIYHQFQMSLSSSFSDVVNGEFTTARNSVIKVRQTPETYSSFRIALLGVPYSDGDQGTVAGNRVTIRNGGVTTVVTRGSGVWSYSFGEGRLGDGPFRHTFPPTPRISEPVIVAGPDVATITTTLSNHINGFAAIVVSRYRRVGQTDWQVGPQFNAIFTSRAVIHFPGTASPLVVGTNYEFQLSLESDFSGAITRTFTTSRSPVLGEPVFVKRIHNEAVIALPVAHPFSTGTTIYFRSRRKGLTNWDPTARTATPASPSPTVSLTGLDENTAYEFQASLNSNFAGAITREFRTTRILPLIRSHIVSDITFVSANITVGVDHAFATGSTLYGRRRVSPAGLWRTISAQTFTPSADTKVFAVTGLSAGITYDYEFAFNTSFTDAVSGSFSTPAMVTPPSLGTPNVVPTDEDAEITVRVGSPAAVGTTTYGQFRKSGVTAWTAMSAQTATPD